MKFFIALQLVVSFALFSQGNPWYSQNPLPQSNIYSIKFFDPNNGIGFSDNGIVIKTSNQGYSWQFIQTPSIRNLYASQFINNNTGYCAGDSGVFMKTTNAGSNWSVLNTGVMNSLNTIFFIDINTGFAAGSGGMLIKTTNGGSSWQQGVIGAKKVNSIFFTSAQNGFAVDSAFAFKTTNGGANWSSQFISAQNNLAVYFIDASIGFVRTLSRLYRTTDGGSSWNMSFDFGLGGRSAAIDFINNLTGYTAGENMPTLITTNSGLNWTGGVGAPSNIFPQFKIFSIDALDTGNVFLSGDKGFVFKSKYSSTEWVHIGGNINNYRFVSFVNVLTGYINSDSYIINTTNGGDKWIINSYGMNNWFEPTSFEYKKIMCKSNGMAIRIWKQTWMGSSEYANLSTNGGLTWPGSTGGFLLIVNDVTLGEDYGYAIFTSTNITVRRAAVSGTWPILYTSPSNTMPLYKVAFHNNNNGAVIGKDNTASTYFLLRTTDAGQNWVSQPLNITNSLVGIQLLPTGTGIILCDSTRLLRTSDFSATWQQRYSGPVRFRTAAMLDDNNGYGLSTGNMFVYTSNGGLSWSQHNTGTTKRLNALHFLDLNTGYIVGDSGTILKTSNGGLTFIDPVVNNIPDVYSISQNYPNPFNPVTNIKYQIPKKGLVKITIYDMLGSEITQLVNQQMQAGSYGVDWDASSYPSGVYFYKLETENFVDSKKMVLLK